MIKATENAKRIEKPANESPELFREELTSLSDTFLYMRTEKMVMISSTKSRYQ
jgi:hypothetical protein